MVDPCVLPVSSLLMAAIKGVYDPFCLKCFKIPFCQCAQNHRRRRRYNLHHSPPPPEATTMTVSAQVEPECHGSPVTEAAIDSAEASIEAVPPLLCIGLVDSSSSDDGSDKSTISSPRRLSLLKTSPAVLVRYFYMIKAKFYHAILMVNMLKFVYGWALPVLNINAKALPHAFFSWQCFITANNLQGSSKNYIVHASHLSNLSGDNWLNCREKQYFQILLFKKMGFYFE